MPYDTWVGTGIRSNYACKLSFLLCEYRVHHQPAKQWIDVSRTARVTCDEDTFLLISLANESERFHRDGF